MRMISTGILASIAFTGFAHAQSFSGADTIVIEDFFGTVELELSGGGAITVARSGANADELTISGGDTAVIRGDREIDHQRWWRAYRKERGDWRGRRARDEDPAFDKLLEDRPKLIISAPAGTDIEIRDSAIKLIAEGDAGDVEINENVHLLVKLGDIESGHLGVHGSGYMEVGNVAGELDAGVHGSGDLIAGNIGSGEVNVHGSGDLEVKNVAGDLDASVHGSGDIEVERVAGAVDASVHGSGDLVIGRVGRGLEASVHGSGDLEVGQVTGGDIEVSIHGSGDLEIDGGSVRQLRAAVRGSGEFEFDGTAESARLRSMGSGGIRVAKVSGEIDADGKNIRVAGKKVGDRDRDRWDD
ncbi:GIN domain-containing protein [Parvularcula lutaonensis]|uniref:GIN domain-containing protein n=1 Tax=Parvularcula lutaonensis TaxID=491923 RepID=A0ABV7MBS4_9PROT|nr:DUF2807 domain-containing protein [Parvularcula lutaonensis]GGY36257.1 hypothetical protein GCM10007148_00510 [Parvularcula lutaonensis]